MSKSEFIDNYLYSYKPIKVLLSDTLSQWIHDDTRKAKRNLLWVSLLGLIKIATGIIPEQIPLLEIKLSGEQQVRLEWILSLVLVYYMFQFLVYFLRDMNNVIDKWFSVLYDQLKPKADEGGMKELNICLSAGAVSKYRFMLRRAPRFFCWQLLGDGLLPAGLPVVLVGFGLFQWIRGIASV